MKHQTKLAPMRRQAQGIEEAYLRQEAAVEGLKKREGALEGDIAEEVKKVKFVEVGMDEEDEKGREGSKASEIERDELVRAERGAKSAIDASKRFIKKAKEAERGAMRQGELVDRAVRRRAVYAKEMSEAEEKADVDMQDVDKSLRSTAVIDTTIASLTPQVMRLKGLIDQRIRKLVLKGEYALEERREHARGDLDRYIKQREKIQRMGGASEHRNEVAKLEMDINRAQARLSKLYTNQEADKMALIDSVKASERATGLYKKYAAFRSQLQDARSQLVAVARKDDVLKEETKKLELRAEADRKAADALGVASGKAKAEREVLKAGRRRDDDEAASESQEAVSLQNLARDLRRRIAQTAQAISESHLRTSKMDSRLDSDKSELASLRQSLTAETGEYNEALGVAREDGERLAAVTARVDRSERQVESDTKESRCDGPAAIQRSPTLAAQEK